MTTLICLISDQHVPNLLTVKAVRPDKLILLVTDLMAKKKTDLWFLRALTVSGMDFTGRAEIINVAKENSVEYVTGILKEACAKNPDDEWIINVTGGTKPMSIGSYLFARENGLRALYIVESDQYTAIDLLGGNPVTLGGLHVTAAEFLAGHGYEIRNPDALIRLNPYVCDLMDLSAALTACHDDHDLFNCLQRLQSMKGNDKGDPTEKEMRKQYDKKGLVLTREDPVFLHDAAIRREIANTFGLQEEEANLIGHLDKKAAEFLTGKWLEYFVFGLLRPLEPAYVRCLYNGLSIGRIDGRGGNELDVSFMTDRSFCMIECKTGSQGYDHAGDQVIYKTEAIKEGLRALRVRAFIATTSPNIIDQGTGETRQALVDRSRIYGIPIINGKTLKELAVMYRRKDPALNDRVADLFLPKKPVSTS